MSNISVSGSFDNTLGFLKRATNSSTYSRLSRYGQMGVDALRSATPQDSGETALSWNYEVVKDSTSWSIIWSNSHVVEGRPIAVLIQYGHATRTGGYVPGRDYINPALRPIFDQMEAEGWRVVSTG